MGLRSFGGIPDVINCYGETLNFAVVVRLSTHCAMGEIIARWAAEPRPSHYYEAVAVDGKTSKELVPWIVSENRDELHVTSRLRVEMLSRYDENR